MRALTDVSLDIRRGEWLSIIGHNGSGKSTLAKLFNGLVVPGRGEVTVEGLSTRDDEQRKRIRQIVGIVFQDPDNQIVATIVEEDVAFGPENLGIGTQWCKSFHHHVEHERHPAGPYHTDRAIEVKHNHARTAA